MNSYMPEISYEAQKQQFDAYYQTKLYPLLAEQETVRRKYLIRFFLLLGLSLIFYPLLVMVTIAVMAKFESTDVGPILLVSGLFVMFLYAPIHKYKKKVKHQIMPQFANFFGTFDYAFEQTIDSEILRQSKLFDDFKINKGDDFFKGIYDGVQITIAEEKLQKPQDMAVMNVCYEHKKNIFGGVCILLEMNKNFEGHTVGLCDRGVFNIFCCPKGLQRVRLEDSRFEKVFEIYAENQIEARYLLTTAFMERLLKLQKLYAGKNIQFSFKDNKLLIAIATKQNMFETNSFFKSNLNRHKIDLAFEQFYAVCSIVHLLKLNIRTGM